MNLAILSGNVGGDPDVRTGPDGKKFASFSLATSKRWKDKTTGELKEKTEWHQIKVSSDGLAGVVEQYVKKGQRILVHGWIKNEAWTDDKGIERKNYSVVVGMGGVLELPPNPNNGRAANTPPVDDDEIPF